MPFATLKSSSWTDNGGGVYTGAYTATTAIPVSLDGLEVNGYTFLPEAGFPTTGFTGANFRLKLKLASATDYTWSTNASWVSVTNDGVVTFTGTGTSDRVTITGTSNNGHGRVVAYSFTLKNWFISSGHMNLNWADANTYCSSRAGYSLPVVAQLTLHSGHVPTRLRGTGALWNEWGNTLSYPGAVFSGAYNWSLDPEDRGDHYSVHLGSGNIGSNYGGNSSGVVCLFFF